VPSKSKILGALEKTEVLWEYVLSYFKVKGKIAFKAQNRRPVASGSDSKRKRPSPPSDDGEDEDDDDDELDDLDDEADAESEADTDEEIATAQAGKSKKTASEYVALIELA
jgi:phosphopantothenoylcysteine synthetase/decarboxylase